MVVKPSASCLIAPFLSESTTSLHNVSAKADNHVALYPDDAFDAFATVHADVCPTHFLCVDHRDDNSQLLAVARPILSTFSQLNAYTDSNICSKVMSFLL